MDLKHSKHVLDKDISNMKTLCNNLDVQPVLFLARVSKSL